MRNLHSVRSLGVAVLSLLGASSLGAQITLEARGTGWANSLTASPVDTMRFRWKWNGAPAATAASWQITFTQPGSVAFPPVVKSSRTALPSAEGQYVSFRIPPDSVPSNAPSTFYVRIRSLNRVSAWLPVTVEGAGAPAVGPSSPPGRGNPSGTPGRSGGNNPVRAGAGTSDAAGVAGALGKPTKKDDKPFVIPGGAALETPLWVRLSEINCQDNHAEDGDDSDEIYAIVATVRVNSNDPFNSMVSASATKTYTLTKCNHAKKSPYAAYPDLKVWGPKDGAPMAIRGPTSEMPNEAIIYAVLMERDEGQKMAIVLEAMRQSIRQALTKNTGQPAGFRVAEAMRSVLPRIENAALGDDWVGLGLVNPKFTAEELASARSGKVVVKRERNCNTGYGTASKRGCYIVEFQIGREGVTAHGPAIAICKKGLKEWYGFSRAAACVGEGGVHQWLPAAGDFKF